MLNIARLEADYGADLIIGPFDLTASSGQIIAIIGPSGCGKSTLLKTVIGLIPSRRGTVSFGSIPLNAKKHTIAYVPQGTGLLPWKTVAKNLESALWQKQRTLEAARPIIDALSIGHLLGAYPKQLSGGEAQRASLARAFALDPDLLLLDEPFGALDAINKEAAQNLFFSIWQQKRPPALFVTHDLEEALFLATDLIVLGSHPATIVKKFKNPGFGSRCHDPALKETIRQLLQGGSL